MARVIPQEVKQIISTSIDPLPFIEAASVIVIDRLTGKGLSNNTLREIERYLSAHLISISLQRQTKTVKIGDASETYTGEFGEGLKSTLYGQMAIALDSSGSLMNVGKQKMVFETINFIDAVES